MVILSCNIWTPHARNIDSSLNKYRIQISSAKKAMALIDYRLEDPASIPGTGRNSLHEMCEVSDITLEAGPTLIAILLLSEAALYHK
jgi:hypothetical protein